ncbi:MAG TPA: heat-inducible transcriptional repressor HrcA [Gemmatimonadaceae bacterium]|nr:heat-inducible transcriptional repressor HrcA [Gemmatimonadaceae bacterium]
MEQQPLTERERRVLEAVIQSYVETAEPTGSRTIARRFGLGVSPATIRNTMSDLEHKGYLFHPHTSAGRVPTDTGYRVYVDSLMRISPVDARARDRLLEHLSTGETAIEAILRRAAQALGVLTHELAVALGPRLDEVRLERLELVRLSSDRLLMVLRLSGGAGHSIFVEVPEEVAERAMAEVTRVLNERLAGLSLREIRATIPTRLRDATADSQARELLNIFIQEGEQLFELPMSGAEPRVLLGQASHLAEQPEFASEAKLRKLLALTDQPEALGAFLLERGARPGITITIGGEHREPSMSDFTVVTAEYRVGALGGVIGVIGPTRMPYEKVISMVAHTSRLITDLLD